MGVGVGGGGCGEIKPERRLVRLDSEEYDSLNPLYLRVREVVKDSKCTGDQTVQIARDQLPRGRGWRGWWRAPGSCPGWGGLS